MNIKEITKKYQKVFVIGILLLVLVIAFLIGQYVVAPNMHKASGNVAQIDETNHTDDIGVEFSIQEMEWVNQYDTTDNPWGYSAGVIDTEESTRAIMLMPDTGVHVKCHIQKEVELPIKYYVHSWVENVSDGLEFSIRVNEDEPQYYEITKDSIGKEMILNLDVSNYQGMDIVIEIQNVNREEADLSGDWLIVEKGYKDNQLSNEVNHNKVEKDLYTDASKELTGEFLLNNKNVLPTENIPFGIIDELKKPVLERGNEGSWDFVDVLNPSVIKFGNQYFNYYSGYDGATWRTGVATSEDGYNWVKYEENPVFGIENIKTEHNDYIAANGSAVVFQNKVYYFYHFCNKMGFAEIGLAISEDGYTFQDQGIVLSTGDEGTWESNAVADPYAIVKNDVIYLYYLGQNEAGIQRLGVAMSIDGMKWTKSVANPILDVGSAGAFDENGLGEPSVYYESPYYYMLYTGRNMKEERNIGLAVSLNGIDWRKFSYNGEFHQSEEWNSAVICDTTFQKVDEEVLVYYGGGNEPEPAQNLNGQIGVFKVDIEQNRNMESWSANADWDNSLVASTDVLFGSYEIEGDEESKSSWCSAITEVELQNNTDKSELFITGWIPVNTIHGMNNVGEVTLRVYINDKLVKEQTFLEDMVFEFSIPKKNDSEVLDIRLEADSEIIPAECIDSSDERTLSYTLQCIEQR